MSKRQHWFGPVALVAALAAAGPAFGQADHYSDIKTPPMPDWEIPQPERVELPNGMVVFLLEDHELPLIEVSARIRAGSRLDPAEKVGLSSVVGQTLRTGGAGDMSGDDIDAFLESRGAVIETGMGSTSASASLSCLKEDFDRVLPLFRDILMKPRFDPEKIELAKVQERTGISRRNDDPNDLTRREFNKLVYGPESPYARHTEYATIEAISRDDLVAYHRRYYKPNAVILGVTGDFETRKMIRKLREAFADWKKAPLQVPDRFAYQKNPNPGLHQIEKNDVTQSVVRIGHLGITLDNPDYHASQVLNQLFGIGFSSRIVQSIRSDKGLAYSVGSALTANYDHPGVFVMVLQTKSGSTVEAIEALYDELDRLYEEPPTAEEVRQAKDGILNSFVFNFQDEGQIVSRIMTYEYFGYPLDFLEGFQKKVDSVTPADVLRVAKKYIHKEDTTVLVTGKLDDFDRPLESIARGEDSPWPNRPVMVATLDVAIPEPAAARPEATAASLDRGRQVAGKIASDLGGRDALLSVEDLKTVTLRTMSTPQGEMEMKSTSYISYPGKFRMEMETPMGAMTMVMNQGEGYIENPMGRQPMPSSMQKDIQGDLARQPVILARLLAEGAAQAQYLGSEDLAGSPVDVILVSVEGVSPFRVYADADSGRIRKIAYQGRGQGGAPTATEVYLSDYRKVEGMPMAHAMKVVQDGETAVTVEVQAVELGPKLDEGLFRTGS